MSASAPSRVRAGAAHALWVAGWASEGKLQVARKPACLIAPQVQARHDSDHTLASARGAAARQVAILVLACIVAMSLIGCAPASVATAPVSVEQRRAQPVVSGVTQSPPPQVALTSTSAPQGGAFAVELRSPDVNAASANFQGRDYPMVGASGLWYAIIGIGQRVGSETVLAVGSYPVTVQYQFSGSRAVSSTKLTLAVTATAFPVDAISIDASEAGLLAPELEASESAELDEAYSAFTPQQLWQGAFAMPVQGQITTAFGARRSYQGGPAIESHPGVDIAVPLGTPVLASADGRVAWTGQLPDRGNGVIIDHGLGVFTGYFHMSRVTAQMGQSVRAGDVIGLAGSTGLSTGPHVHWEVVVGGVNLDGLQFLDLTFP